MIGEVAEKPRGCFGAEALVGHRAERLATARSPQGWGRRAGSVGGRVKSVGLPPKGVGWSGKSVAKKVIARPGVQIG